MLQNVACIALRTVRHNDKQNLLSVWSRQVGRLTLTMPAGAGREATRRRALTRPFYCFEGVVDIRPGREIFSMRDLRPFGPVASAKMAVIKDMVGIFIAEVLDIILRQAAPDNDLSDFLFEAAEILHEAEAEEVLSYFPPVFLLRLTNHLGVGPDLESSGNVFDLREGRFRTALPVHRDILDGTEADDLRKLGVHSFSSAPALNWNRARRNATLDALLRYLSIHITPLTSLHSLATLREW